MVDAPTGESETFGSSPADDMIWGRHPALAALESGRPIHRIWCTAEMRFTPKFLQLLREAKSAGVLVEEVTWARLGQLTAGAVHQGIALQAAAAETLDLDSLISGCRDIGEPPLLMAVDGLTDPHNLGAVVRSAEGAGATGVVVPQDGAVHVTAAPSAPSIEPHSGLFSVGAGGAEQAERKSNIGRLRGDCKDRNM